MSDSLYLDTSVIGYVASRLSRDVLTLAHQQLTRDWWAAHRQRFELHVSELVLFEASRGDPEAARERLQILEGLPVLRITQEARTLAIRSSALHNSRTRPPQTPCIWHYRQSTVWTFSPRGTVLISRMPLF